MEEDPTALWLEGEARGYYPGNLWDTSPGLLWADISPLPHRKAHSCGPTRARH